MGALFQNLVAARLGDAGFTLGSDIDPVRLSMAEHNLGLGGPAVALCRADALRPVSGNRFLQAEGPGNRVTYVDIEGDRAVITPVRTGLDSSPGVTHFGNVGYATEGKIGYLFDPALRGKDPGSFVSAPAAEYG